MAVPKGYWFPAKRYGWGWGPPRTWQGWVVLVVFMALEGVAAVATLPRAPGRFAGAPPTGRTPSPSPEDVLKITTATAGAKVPMTEAMTVGTIGAQLKVAAAPVIADRIAGSSGTSLLRRNSRASRPGRRSRSWSRARFRPQTPASGSTAAAHDHLQEDHPMLQLRPCCECCGRDLPAESPDARICSFECTFCAACAAGTLGGRCPNCAGELVARPRRAAALLGRYPASTERVVRADGCPASA